MTVFGQYARYYDLLYRDKDYLGETRFTEKLLQKHAPAARKILELGCGTGIHASQLVRDGYEVHGVDLSETMLAAAIDRRARLDTKDRERLSFSLGNARDVRLDSTFDAVVALFHVVSYQVTDEELGAIFETASRHLAPGGVFLFDFWFGPAVLATRPTVREKQLESAEITVSRIATPEMNERDRYVDVRYQVFIHDKATGSTDQLRESHRMRYLDLEEIEKLAHMSGFRLLDACEWMSGRTPGADTWGVCAVAGK